MPDATGTMLSTDIHVEVGGRPIDSAFELVRLVVDENLHAPALCELEVVELSSAALHRLPFAVGDEVTVQVDVADGPVTLFDGEVAAVGMEIDETAARVTARCYDRAHRLQRGTKTRTFLETTVSSVVADVAGAAGLTVGRSTRTSVRYPQISQVNVDDWTFLQYLADRLGWMSAVVRGKLVFGPVEADPSRPPLEIERRVTRLRRFRSTISSAQQVRDVEVRLWDDAKQEPGAVTVPVTAASASTGTAPAALARPFGSNRLVEPSAAPRSIEEAQALAEGLAARVGGTFAEVEAEVEGDPAWVVGRALRLVGFGTPLDGTVMVTATHHVWDEGNGYLTTVVASDGRDRSLLGLVGGDGASRTNRIDGLVAATVVDTRDPERLDRVKVALPWFDEALESGWARTVQVGAGSGRGMRFIPEVGDEVLVGFENGDVARPYVLGGMYSAINKPFQTDGSILNDKEVDQRVMASRTGQRIVLSDASGDEGVRIIDGQNRTTFVVGGKDGGLTVTTSKPVTITSDGDVSLKAGRTLTLTGAEVTISATSKLALSSDGELVADGMTTAVRAKSQLELSANAVASLKGAMVEIN